MVLSLVSSLTRSVLLALCIISVPALVGCATPIAAQPYYESEISLGYFHERLSPYGRWFFHPRWGDVWQVQAAYRYRPYYAGRWE